ncbi:carbonic anhydrase family protein [Nitrosospira multiformis]|uniref:carbonic anhydrase n=1 Tax=Nitrosospira multiformis (strain ATCC 25196 / NCIMB 11849 / C 71) TaxID=323848 RepID=Q2YBV2_NITMU|nr:carbonic anhydrase family protein [Nitrosospira multiformis]ABB73769.1 Carbonate dehydratase [Nitrosospira multiformis ATCC 25196]SDZ74089.1 carbonic anhydrase [Nitrosospira multiformis]SEF41415.1 carbonic anhydrase [Nitrosospira multiformis ATCC 25196]
MNETSRSLRVAVLAAVLFLLGFNTAYASTLASNLELMEAQSPIDIRSNSTYYGNLPKLNFNLNSDTALTVINNGSPDHESTIRANVSPGGGTLMLSGHQWNLAQFHFHTPSEHLINGRASPMEMHLVFSDAANNLLVVGRDIEQGLFKNQALAPIFSDLPKTTEETLNIEHFNLNNLLPDYLGSFRYSGSLTTPPFTEGVSWVELASPLYLSGSQINAFKSLFPEGNSREIQDLNGRIVLTDVPGFVSIHDDSDPNLLGTLIPGLEASVSVTADLSKLATSVPEPSSYGMLLAGLAVISFIGLKRGSRLAGAT